MAPSVCLPSYRDPLLVKNYFSAFGAKLPRANSVILLESIQNSKKNSSPCFKLSITHRARQLDAHALILVYGKTDIHQWFLWSLSYAKRDGKILLRWIPISSQHETTVNWNTLYRYNRGLPTCEFIGESIGQAACRSQLQGQSRSRRGLVLPLTRQLPEWTKPKLSIL